MPAVLIVDDRELVRHGLMQMLSRECGDLSVGEAKSSDEATVRLAEQPWDLIILDAAFPGKNPFDSVLKEIRGRHPSTRVLMLGRTHLDSEHQLRAQQLGATGYICENAGSDELLQALKRVLAGKKYDVVTSSPGIVVPVVPGYAALSTREYEVMLAIVAGKRPSQIAAELNLSIKTISTYRRRLFNKFRVQSMAELVSIVIGHKLS